MARPGGPQATSEQTFDLRTMLLSSHREAALVEHVLERTLVRCILEHAVDYPWRVQSLGVLCLWLDDQRPATPDQVERIVALALALFEDTHSA